MKYPLTCLQGNNNLAFVSASLRPFAGDTAVGTGTGFFFQPVFERVFLITNRHMDSIAFLSGATCRGFILLFAL